MPDKNWDTFIDLYCKLFSVDRYFVEILAVNDILILIVSGYSNKTVAKRLDMDEDYISEVARDFLGFSGLNEDMDINPYFAFRRSTSLEDFIHEIQIISPLDINYTLWYNICNTYNEIDKELSSFYGKTNA
jgi:hypothetical protein